MKIVKSMGIEWEYSMEKIKRSTRCWEMYEYVMIKNQYIYIYTYVYRYIYICIHRIWDLNQTDLDSICFLLQESSG